MKELFGLLFMGATPAQVAFNFIMVSLGIALSLIPNLNKGIKKDELLTEIENIVNSGTKLNLSKYVFEVSDEEIIEEVMDFFRKTNDNVMEAALKEYGEEFSKDDLHLMHIHFISEMAN